MSLDLIKLGINAKKASKIKIDTNKKNKVLKKFLQLIKKNKKIILKENNKDVNFAKRNDVKENLIERLKLSEKKLDEIQYSINKIIKFWLINFLK